MERALNEMEEEVCRDPPSDGDKERSQGKRNGRAENNTLARTCICTHRPSRQAFERRRDGAMWFTALYLSNRVTLHLELDGVQDVQAVFNTVERLPVVSCVSR